MGSDGVVQAYNDLMQYTYSAQGKTEGDKLIGLLGAFLLQIRRSMGNDGTALDQWGMLEWFINDARAFRDRAS